MSSAENKAVFLSYASQDVDAAKKVCEALRAAAIEVWLDQGGGLVGGDAWDLKIRGQISTCALFVPLISANTQARDEGYFRLEWKLAAQRTHMMTEGKAFLLPLVIDDTRDAEAKVPAEFRAVQWTRAPKGEAPPAFGPRLVQLLDGKLVAAERPSASREAVAAAHVKSRPHWSWRISVACVAGTIGALLLWQPWQKETDPRVRETDTRATLPASVPLMASDKSIAVLPFDNVSADQENAFFADGIHEDVLTALQTIRELRVLSRTTMMQYRARGQKSLPEIARELGVAYILEGSVRRWGNRVKVTAQLIDARTDAPLWALPAGEHELTDIFAVQSQLAKAIATELKATISPQEKILLERRPTENAAAYDLFLKAREIGDVTGRGGSVRAKILAAETFLREAVRLDPAFAEAWAEIAFSNSRLYGGNYDHTLARIEHAKDALDHAIALAPNQPEVLRAAGFYYYSAFRDYDRASEQYNKALRLRPNDPRVLRAVAGMRRQQAQWQDAVALYRRAVELDPGNSGLSGVYGYTLERVRLYEQALAERRRRVRMFPNDLEIAFQPAMTAFRANGSTIEASEFLARLTRSQAESSTGRRLRRWWASQTGNFSEYLGLEESTRNDQPDEPGTPAGLRGLEFAQVLAASGDIAAAQRYLLEGGADRYRRRVNGEPENDFAWRSLAEVEALLGNKDEALRCVREALKLAPEAVDAMDGAKVSRSLAFVYAWTGDKERALAEYARLLLIPGAELNVHEMRRAAEFFPLQGDPRFEALLRDPKNNRPLF